MNKKFKVGDEVMISESSIYYGRSKCNPKDVEGVIISILGEGSHWVQWSNGGYNKYKASDLIMVEEVKKKEKKSIHGILVERSTLEVGDIVKVTHRVPSYDLGWENSWCDDMLYAIGEECSVIDGPDGKGVQLNDGGANYRYPLQSVQFVRKAPKTEKVILTKDYDAVVSKEGIKVGCQTITFKAFDELAEAVAKMRK